MKLFCCGAGGQPPPPQAPRRMNSQQPQVSSGVKQGQGPQPTHPSLPHHQSHHHQLQQQQQQHHQQPQRPASTTPLDRLAGYHPSSALFDDDPGIMSEIETSATGFRRGNKVRSSLPIVRTPSKTQDRSLGLVFLQFRSETKRALLPNEITSLDTVKALFVRSFPRQLSMEYLDCPVIRIYIHDPSKDMFYELEDFRDIRDRCVLRIYEHGANGPQPVGGPANMPNTWSDADQFGYFSEPEFESEYQSQHIHRSKRGVPDKPLPLTGGQSQYYGTIILPPQYRSQTMTGRQPYGAGHPPQPPERNKPFPGYSQTLPRNAHMVPLYSNTNDANTNQTNQNQSQVMAGVVGVQLPTQRAVSPDLLQKARPKDNSMVQMMSSGPPPKPQRSFAGRTGLPPTQPLTSPQLVGPQYHPQNRPLPDRPYSVAGHYPSPDMGRNYGQDFSGYLSSPERRMPQETQTHVRASFSGYPSSMQFEDPYGMYGMRSGAATPVIDEEARVRMQQMERQIQSLTNVVSKVLTPTTGPKSDKSGKPAPPPKPAALVGYRGELPFHLTIDVLSQLKQIRKKTKDLRGEVRSLRRLALQQTNSAKETLRDTCAKIKQTLSFLSGSTDCQFRLERLRLSQDRDIYGHDSGRLDKDLHELETQVEELRSNVINRRCRVNMSHVETMALVLSRASKTVADLKGRFPPLSQTMKTVMSQEMECCVHEEKFLKDEPERLEMALKRCKKLTGTLVTLKRLASVQEQRSTTNANSSSPSSQLLQSASTDSADGSRMYDSDMEPHTIIQVTPATPLPSDASKTNVLDSLLDELQTFSKPTTTNTSTITSTTSGQTSTAKKLLQSIGSVDSTVTKKGPIGSTIPAPPPRSSSRINPVVLPSFAARPPASALRSNSEPSAANRPRSTPPEGVMDGDDILVPPSSSITSLSSVSSQGSVVEKRFAQSRQELLEQRHQELLKKQRLLQEQYTRLQQLSRGQIPRGLLNDLKKTGSESNIVSKTSLNMSTVHGSLRDIVSHTTTTTNGVVNDSVNQKIFETDIL